MRTVLVSVFIHHPFQHLATAVVVEVGINIGQRDTVRIQETLEQQVVFQRVNLRDTQAICHHRTSRRATTRSHPHVQYVACRVDEVLHNEEVTRKTHGFHDMQFEADTVVDLLG